jgi:apolipoprotein N-acyltransferase
MVHFTAGMAWLLRLHPLLPIGLFAILSLYPLLFAFLFRRVAALGPRWAALSLPFLWVAVDWLREHLATGFPWLLPAHAAAGWADFRQASDLGGEHLLTLVLVLANAAGAVLVLGLRAPGAALLPGPRVRRGLLAAAVLLPVLLVAYGAARRGSLVDRPGPRLLLVQPCVPMELKGAALEGDGEEFRARLVNDQLALSLQGLIDRSREAPDGEVAVDLVVWAETMVPGVLRDWGRAEGVPDGETQRLLAGIVDAVGVVPGGPRRFLGGAVMLDRDGRRRNAVLLVGPRGVIEGRFDKVHLTPFGEYVPLLSLLPDAARVRVEDWILGFSPFLPDLLPGSAEPFPLRLGDGRTVRFGGLVCYEIIFPDLARERTREGADVLINPANYGWYGGGIHPQVLDVARLRAVECRRPVVLATVNGPTAVLDGNGEVRREASPGERTALWAEVPLDGRGSAYLASGDLVAWLAAAWTLAAAGAGFAAGRGARRAVPDRAPPGPEST